MLLNTHAAMTIATLQHEEDIRRAELRRLANVAQVQHRRRPFSFRPLRLRLKTQRRLQTSY